MDINETISKLTALWYESIGGEHHKDRDCFFMITKEWSYDGKLKYLVDHHGYLQEFHEEFSHPQAAHEFLANKIAENIKEMADAEIKYYTETPRSPQEPIAHWQKILDRLSKILDNA